MDFIDYYKVLEIDKRATDEDMKKAYRILARKLHPDLNPNDKDAQKKFQKINRANEVLGDPENAKNTTSMAKTGNMRTSLNSNAGHSKIQHAGNSSTEMTETFQDFLNRCSVDRVEGAEVNSGDRIIILKCNFCDLAELKPKGK